LVETLVAGPPGFEASRLERTLERLPRDVGVVLITLGAAGLVIPGPIPPGTPFLVVGAVFLCPKLARPLGGRLRRRFPTFYNALDDQVTRFRSDLERRYPGSTRPDRDEGPAELVRPAPGRLSCNGPDRTYDP